jgi:integrase
MASSTSGGVAIARCEKNGSRATRTKCLLFCSGSLRKVVRQKRVFFTQPQREGQARRLPRAFGLFFHEKVLCRNKPVEDGGEVCGLRKDDLDLKGESITVRRLKGSLETRQPLCGHAGQPLLDELKAIRQWMKDRGADGSDYVFTSQKGGRMHRSQFFRIFQNCAESAGLP